MPLHPISFSICASKVVDAVPNKTQLLSTIVPGQPYAYTSETAYYAEYRRSWFAITVSKMGWDCMRHYEILSQGCIPLFLDLEQCPENTLTHFPKSLVQQGMHLYNTIVDTGASYQDPDVTHTLTTLVEELLVHTRTYLTNERMATWMLDRVLPAFSGPFLTTSVSVLFISACPHPDYLRCHLLTGLKRLMGSTCHDICRVDHLYEDYHDDNVSKCYGKGFSYTRTLPTSSRDDHRDDTVLDDIRHHAYDVIVYGSYHRDGGLGLPYWNEVHEAYAPSEVVLLCGEDRLTDICTHDHHTWADYGYHVFVRELA